ncbi:MAG: sensor histidine kinase [Oscillospiraceae bacterium]
MKIKNSSVLVRSIIIIISVIVLLFACMNSNQAAMAFLLPNRFVGEYSFDDGNTWEPLDETTKLSAYDGSIVLRGNFEYDFPELEPINFYLEHITMDIYINGEPFCLDSRNQIGLTPSNCCMQWITLRSTGIYHEDTVEIHLHNPHKFGNKDAYNKFLNRIYSCEPEIFGSMMLKSGQRSRIVGIAVIVAAIMLLAVYLAFCQLKIEGGRHIGNLGFFALFFGGYIAMDTSDISLWSELNVFNTYGLQICIMLSGFMAVMCVSETLKGSAARIANIMVIASAAVSGILLTISLLGFTVLYDTAVHWLSAHIVIYIILLGCCIYSLVRRKCTDLFSLWSYIILISMALADGINYFAEIGFSNGMFSKIAFLIMFVIQLIRTIKEIPADYIAARQADELRAELTDSRISIMLSQIQPHFLYNVLNSIYCLCEKDIDAAQAAISDFSDYLRGNMNSITKKDLVPFSTELDHLKTYISLEKMRFGDKLDIVWDIQTDNFMLPALTVQPIVENAVNHGICSSDNGGTITITTRETDASIEIEVHDDGVGFDENEYINDREGHIGIMNVRSRLNKMCGGELDIKSSLGVGTTAVIRLPK